MSVPTRRLTLSDIRFKVMRAVQGLSRATLRDLAGKPDKRAAAIEATAEAVIERLKECEFSEPDVKSKDFGDLNPR